MFCSWGERAPPPGLAAKSNFYVLYLTGHGDQCDVPFKNSEGSGGWSHSRNEGTGGHHWVHQAGADSKSAWQVKPLLSVYIGSQLMRNSLSAKNGSMMVRVICVYYSKQKIRSFSFFCPMLSAQLLPSSFPLNTSRFLTALIRSWLASTGREGKERELVFL